MTRIVARLEEGGLRRRASSTPPTAASRASRITDAGRDAARPQPHPQGRLPRAARRRAHRRRARAARARAPLLERLQDDDASDAASLRGTFHSMHVAQLPPVLRRPVHLAVRHVDADDRPRLARAAPVAQQRLRRRARHRAAVPAHAPVRRVGRRDRRPLRQAQVLLVHRRSRWRGGRCCSPCSTLTGVVAALDALRDRVRLRAWRWRSTTRPAQSFVSELVPPGRPPQRDRAQQRASSRSRASSAPRLAGVLIVAGRHRRAASRSTRCRSSFVIGALLMMRTQRAAPLERRSAARRARCARASATSGDTPELRSILLLTLVVGTLRDQLAGRAAAAGQDHVRRRTPRSTAG